MTVDKSTRIKSAKKVIGLGCFSTIGKVYLVYKAPSNTKGRFNIAVSEDGLSFSLKHKDIQINGGEIPIESGDHWRFTKLSKGWKLVITTKAGIVHFIDVRKITDWVYQGTYSGIGRSNITVFDKEKEYLYFENMGNLCVSEKNRSDSFSDEKILAVVGAGVGGEKIVSHVLKLKEKVALFFIDKKDGRFSEWLIIIDDLKSAKVLWSSPRSTWEQSGEWPLSGNTFLGTVKNNGRLISYWQVSGWGIYAVIHSFYRLPKLLQTKTHLKLKKSETNPIISPNSKNTWEAFNTFNPAALYEGGRVHIVYRAQGYDYVSVLGYASSSDGYKIDERHEEPIYTPRAEFEWNGKEGFGVRADFVSGGGFGGCEDPRLTRIADRIYMTYVAFDGWSPPRVALTSIAVDDFLNHRWLWERPVLITRPGEVNKNCVIFPRKINGRYVVMHRVFPDILLDYVDDLDFDGSRYLTGQYRIKHRNNMWDSRKLGAGAPPLETKYGWLLIYQAVDDRDPGRYKIGAMLLDINAPEKVLFRSQLPILDPTEWYENEGFKAGVAYPCGAVIKGEELLVYYGAADSVVCVASTNLEEFLQGLMHNRITHLDPAQVIKVL